jgi:hypothetical protein
VPVNCFKHSVHYEQGCYLQGDERNVHLSVGRTDSLLYLLDRC